MPVNDRWRLPLQRWDGRFTSWLTEPTPEATLQVFFDMRPVAGDASLHARLVADVRERTRSAQVFLLHLAKRVAAHEPPLGIFRGLVVERRGEHRDTLDIKWGGIGAVVELARVHALAAGVPEVGTRARLAAAAAHGRLEQERAQDLQDAFEFVSYLRLRHQTRQVRAGQEPAGTKAIRHPVVGELTVAFETLTLASAPDIRIVTYLTDPGTPSADALDLLRSWVATTTTIPVPPRSSEASQQRNDTTAAD